MHVAAPLLHQRTVNVNCAAVVGAAGVAVAAVGVVLLLEGEGSAERAQRSRDDDTRLGQIGLGQAEAVRIPAAVSRGVRDLDVALGNETQTVRTFGNAIAIDIRQTAVDEAGVGVADVVEDPHRLRATESDLTGHSAEHVERTVHEDALPPVHGNEDITGGIEERAGGPPIKDDVRAVAAGAVRHAGHGKVPALVGCAHAEVFGGGRKLERRRVELRWRAEELHGSPGSKVVAAEEAVEKDHLSGNPYGVVRADGTV